MKIPSERRISVGWHSHVGGMDMTRMFTPKEALELIRNHSGYWIVIDNRIVNKEQIELADLSKVSKIRMVAQLQGGARRKILVVGAGGIGGALTELIARAAAFSNLTSKMGPITISLMDADLVERHNLPHQRFSTKDIGRPKVEALANQLRDAGVDELQGVILNPIVENLSSETDLSEYDIVVIAVDREEPRRLVHENAKAWLDLRCRGDGFLMWSHLDDIRVLNRFPALADGESASCQLEGAIEDGNIQFGFVNAASHGAQWLIQWLRGSQVPSARTYSIHMGDLPLPFASEEEE